jgi:hypothetical protein
MQDKRMDANLSSASLMFYFAMFSEEFVAPLAFDHFRGGPYIETGAITSEALLATGPYIETGAITSEALLATGPYIETGAITSEALLAAGFTV